MSPNKASTLSGTVFVFSVTRFIMLTTFSGKQMNVSVSLVVQFLISCHTLPRVQSTGLSFKYSCKRSKTSGGSTFTQVLYLILLSTSNPLHFRGKYCTF